MVVTTVKDVGAGVKPKYDCVLTKAQKTFASRDDERPILPVIYKTSEFGGESNHCYDMVWTVL